MLPVLRQTLRVLVPSVVLALACAPGDRPPVAPMRGTLAVGGERGPSEAKAPFAVVFAAPQGEGATAAELSLVFNRPLRRLETAEQAPPPPVKVDPPIAGHWLWVGSTALRFEPADQRLPAASRFTVEVPADARALDGSTLGKPFRFEFTTPRPAIVGEEPYDGSEGLPLDAKFTLEWNQPVDPVAFERAATLVATRDRKPATPLPFTARRPSPNLTKKLVITPKGRLPVDSALELRVSPELVGEAGPLPMGKPTVLSYRTYGPLRVERVDCDTDTPHGDCAPGGSLGVTLTNPVKRRDLQKALTVDPPVALRAAGGEADESSRYLGIVGKFEPGQRYTLTLSADVTDEHGQRLGAPFQHSFRIDDYFPYAELGVTGDTLVPSQVRPIEIGSVNVASFDLLTASITPAELPRFLDTDVRGELLERLVALKKTKRRKVTPAAAKNTMAKDPLAISDTLPRGRGVLAMGIRYARDPKDYREGKTFHLLKVTNLGVSAKLSPHGSLVWVTRLDDGAPVPGAKVQIHSRGEPVGDVYETDAQGFAKLPPGTALPDAYERTALVVVSKDEDWTYESFASHIDQWRLPVPVDLSAAQREYGMLFAERGIYRPGETVKVKGIVRDETPSGNAIPAGKKLSLALYSAEGDKVSDAEVTTSRWGTLAADLRVPGSAGLGQWSVRLTGGKDAPQEIASESFSIAEYRPSEFKVTADAGAPSYVRGQSADFSVSADYLFGAPMPGAKTTYSITRGTSWFEPPGTEGFATDARTYDSDLPEHALDSAVLKSDETTLDARGTTTVKVPLPMPGQRNTEVLRFDAEVTDVSRQAIAGSASALVHPAEFYLGLQYPEDYFVAAPGDVTAKVIAVTPLGKRLPGKVVHVELVHRRWTSAREATGDGDSRPVSRVVDRVAAACDVSTAATPVACTLRADQTGYYVVVARSKDGRGNEAVASYGFYGTGSGAGASFADSSQGLVELVPNKKQYAVGDTAQILVKSPFAEAEALVTVERAGVYQSKKVTLKGAASTVSVSVTDDLRPNAYVSVHLLRSARASRSAAAKGVGPLYRMGYTELKIDPEARRLAVLVKANKQDYRPGEEVTVDLDVKAKGNAPATAELTVYAVDEGVLMLTGYRTPDPLPVFTASRPLQVATLETRESMAKIGLEDFVLALGSDKGEEGGGGGEGSARKDFKTTAFFDPHVVTDASGHASVKFKLPDNLTTFRIMAVAASESDRYGFGQTSVVTSKRLMARPNLPRFLRAGDRAEAGIVVSSKLGTRATVQVKAAVTGLTLEGAAERSIELPPGGSQEVRFPFVAAEAGSAGFRFDVRAGADADAVSVTRAVQSPATLETVALYGETKDVAAEGMGDYAALRRDVGGLDVSLSSSVLVGLDGSAASLTVYPYECTEQLSSRLLPLVPLRELAERFGFALPGNATSVIGQTLRDILARQQSDGGFGMWPESPRSSPFVSAYATWALHEAAAHGQQVPKRAMDRAQMYLRQVLASLDAQALSRAQAAMIVDVLSTIGAPDPGYMGKLYEGRRELPLFARAFLLHALAVGKGPPETVKALSDELSSELRLANDAAFPAENVGDEYAVLLDSTARTSALVLRALLAVDPEHPLIGKLTRGLLSLRRGGTWRTTQETAYSLVALDAYWRAREKTPAQFSAKVWLGETSLLAGAFDAGRSVQKAEIPLSRFPERGAGNLVFQKQGSGTLFYEARLRYARRTLPAAPLDAGFFVQKALRGVDPAGLPRAIETIAATGTTTFRAGDLVLADLVVVTPGPREFVVLDDPLPAGFEAVDTGLATSASWLDVPGSTVSGEGDESSRDAQAHGRAFGWSWYRREVRDDRVVFFIDHMPAGMYHYRYLARATTYGSFVVPPTKAEEMYTPETFGRTGAQSIVVQ